MLEQEGQGAQAPPPQIFGQLRQIWIINFAIAPNLQLHSNHSVLHTNHCHIYIDMSMCIIIHDNDNDNDNDMIIYHLLQIQGAPPPKLKHLPAPMVYSFCFFAGAVYSSCIYRDV